MFKTAHAVDLRKKRLDVRKEDQVQLKRSSFADMVTLVNNELVDRWNDKIEKKKAVVILPRIQALVNEHDLHIPGIPQSRLVDHLFNSITGYDILHPYVANPAITNIEIESPNDIYYMEGLRWKKAPVSFDSQKALQDYVYRIFNRLGGRFSMDNPLGKVEDDDWNLRIRAGGWDVSPDGVTMSMRKLSKDILTQLELDYGMSRMMQRFMKFAIAAGFNVDVVGPFGSGKTRLLGTFMSWLPTFKHNCLIQSANEIPKVHPFMRRRLTRELVGEQGQKITESDIMNFAKQENYQAIGLGEFLDEVAMIYLHLLQLNTQILSTHHAESGLGGIHSLVYMMRSGDKRAREEYLIKQLAEQMDLVVVTNKLRVVEIAQYTGEIRNGDPVVEPLFTFHVDQEDKHELIGTWKREEAIKLCSKLLRKARMNGQEIPADMELV